MWTILGPMIVLFASSITVTTTLFVRTDSKIEALDNKLEAKIDDQGKELISLGNKISKIEGQMGAVLELVPHPATT